jgi:hypothetical protein
MEAVDELRARAKAIGKNPNAIAKALGLPPMTVRRFLGKKNSLESTLSRIEAALATSLGAGWAKAPPYGGDADHCYHPKPLAAGSSDPNVHQSEES